MYLRWVVIKLRFLTSHRIMQIKNSSPSSNYRGLMLDIGLFYCTPLRSVLDFSHSVHASHLAQVVTLPGLWMPHTTFAETRTMLDYYNITKSENKQSYIYRIYHIIYTKRAAIFLYTAYNTLLQRTLKYLNKLIVPL